MDGIEFINFPCPQCQSRQRAAKHLAGRTLTCMQCRTAFKVPAESSLEPVPVAERSSKADFELPVETSAAPLPEVPLSLPPVSEAALESVASDEFADAAPMDAALTEAPLEAAIATGAPPTEEPMLSLEGDAAAPVDSEAALLGAGMPLEGELPPAEAAPIGEPALNLESDLQLAAEAPIEAAPVAAAEPVLDLEGAVAPAPIPEEELLLFPEEGDVLAIAPEAPAPAPHPATPAKAQPV